MKKLLAVASGMLLVGFLLATVMAGSNTPAPDNGQIVLESLLKKKDPPKKGDPLKKSAVPQSRIDTVTKQDKAAEHVDAMLKKRAETIAAADKADRDGKGKKTIK